MATQHSNPVAPWSGPLLGAAALLLLGCSWGGDDGRVAAQHRCGHKQAIGGARPPAPTTSAQISQDIAAALREIDEDPPPARIIKGTHYFISNEDHPERFHPAVTDLGGMFVGVGAEQNYLFAGWAKPAALVLLDFDQVVVDVHELYRIFLLASHHPDGLIDRWSPKHFEGSRQLIAAAAPSATRRAQLEWTHDLTHLGVWTRLLSLRRLFRAYRIPSVWTDQDQYDHLVWLLRQGRVRALRGDLTGRSTMADVAQLARRLGLPVRGMYLSNVEYYFGYDTGLGRNLLALPVDDRSLILRSVPIDGDSYYYVVQRSHDFNAWLTSGRIQRIGELLTFGKLEPSRGGAFTIGPPPPRPWRGPSAPVAAALDNAASGAAR